MAIVLLLLSAAACKAADGSGKNTQAPGYTRQDVWAAYEGFNNTFLDTRKYIYKTDTSFGQAIDRGRGAAAIWCRPIYWEMAMNAYKSSRGGEGQKESQGDEKALREDFRRKQGALRRV